LEAQGKLEAALRQALTLSDELDSSSLWPHLQLAASYVAMSCGSKLGNQDAVATADALAGKALRRLGDHPWEAHYRRTQGIAAIHDSRFDDHSGGLNSPTLQQACLTTESIPCCRLL
jgi:hypothetical protein